MKSIMKYAALASLFAAGTAQAIPAPYITGVTATANVGTASGALVQIVNGAGLTALSLSASHANGSTNNLWGGAGTSSTITFNLHDSYVLTDLAVWNFNGSNTAGVRDVQISTSTDGSNFAALVGGPTQFAIGNNNAAELAQLFSFGPVTASFVRFNISSNYGFSGVTGLSEVGFGGTLASSAVPEPTTLALFGIGTAGFAARRRRA